MSLAAVLTGLFITSFLLTGAIRRYALRGGLLDFPVSRSLHEQATPVGGGIVIALLFLAYAGSLGLLGDIESHEFLALAGGALVALVGLLDDLWKLSLSWRIPAQFAAAVWAVFWLGNVPPINFLFFTLGESLLLDTLAVLALVWLLNLYNFMDGIDGLAAGELVFVNALGFMIAVYADDAALGLLSAGLGAPHWAFLPGTGRRPFSGDPAATSIGSSWRGLLSMLHGSMTVWTWLLLLGVFFSDLRNAVRRVSGARWFEGHCSMPITAVERLGATAGSPCGVGLNVSGFSRLPWLTVMRPNGVSRWHWRACAARITLRAPRQRGAGRWRSCRKAGSINECICTISLFPAP